MKRFSRRRLLQAAGMASAGLCMGGGIPRVLGQAAPDGPFKLPALPYPNDALEPHFDATTMTIHHDRHHAAYVANLNKAIAPHPELQKLSVEELLTTLDKVPEAIRAAVRNNAGGHFNHSLFWQSLRKEGGPQPEGPLAEALGALFEDKEQGEQAFLQKALSLFGSGWIWLSLGKDKKITLETTPNQDNPLLFGRQPLVGLDLWEHAYYLKYQNRRADYVKAFYNIINWEFVQQRFEKLTA